MNVHHRSHAPRLFLLVALGLLLLTTHLPGGAAQVAPEQMGLTYLAALQGTDPLNPALTIGQTAVLHTPEGIYHGREGFDDYARSMQGSFSDLTYAVRNPSVSGGDIIVHFVMTGTHTGWYQGMVASCAGVKVPGVAVLSIDSHGISEQWISYDQGTLIAQIEQAQQQGQGNSSDCPAAHPGEPLRDPVCIHRNRCHANY